MASSVFQNNILNARTWSKYKMNLRDNSPILICVDLQKKFTDEKYWGGGKYNKDADATCSLILKEWRNIGLDIIHVRQNLESSKSKLNKNDKDFMFNPMNTPLVWETVITRSSNCVFDGTNLKKLIASKGCNTLVIIGLTIDHCVSTVARRASSHGYKSYIVSDASAFDKVGVDGAHFSADLIYNTEQEGSNIDFVSVLDSEHLLKIL